MEKEHIEVKVLAFSGWLNIEFYYRIRFRFFLDFIFELEMKFDLSK